MFKETVDFIRELYGKPEGFIPLHAPVFNGNEKKYLEECIDTTFVSSVGKFVDLFEDKMAEYTGAKKAVVCVNGTNALHLALKLVGVERGTEVITQPLTFIATANAIAYCDAHPVFIDVDMETLGMSPDSLLEFLDKHSVADSKTGKRINKATKNIISAVLPMHTFGHPCRIEDIVEICERYQVPLVEDAAESLGSYYKGKHTGTFGEIGVLSFNGNKILTTGGGGMLLFHDEELAIRAKHLTTQAKVPHPWEFVHDAIGYNYRMPNINAALGLAQLEQLPGFLENKRDTAEKYKSFFANTLWTFFTEPKHAQSNYWLNVIFVKDRKERDEFLKYSNENGVMTRPAWELMSRLDMFKNSSSAILKKAELISNILVNIPSSINSKNN
jgi:aminotransferase in exopolysaccharide biosynthesis